METLIILSDMKKSIDILLNTLGAKHITKHVVCPSAKSIIQQTSCNIPDAIVIIDERSAGYVATGMSEEADTPVVIWCANNDSFRNLAPSLTEAYYRKLPLLVVALEEGLCINQTVNPNDIIRYNLSQYKTEPLTLEYKIEAAIDYLYAEIKGPVYLSLGLPDEIISSDNKQLVDAYETIDISSLIELLPLDACVHIGKGIQCKGERFIDILYRTDHCTKDGHVSMLIGSSIVYREQLHIGIFTYDEIAYDMNMLGNRHIGDNLFVLSFMSHNQNSSIPEFAEKMEWDCRCVSMKDINVIANLFVKSGKPHFIEVTQ